MNINYFLRKQNLLISQISTEFVRTDYLEYLKKDEKLVGIIGSRGVGKTTLQIKDIENSYVVADIDYTVDDKKIPLWLFGFLG